MGENKILIKYTRYNNSSMVSYCEADDMQQAEKIKRRLLELRHVTSVAIIGKLGKH